MGREAVKRSPWMSHFCPYLVLLDMNTVHSHAVSIQPEPFNSILRLPFLLLLSTNLLPVFQSRCHPSFSHLAFSFL